jgi:hypothetical protein
MLSLRVEHVSMSRSSSVVALCLLGSLVVGSGTAAAFCRTQSCDSSSANADDDGCEKDANGCSVDGQPLIWPDTCLSFAVQRDGSDDDSITPAQLESLVQTAFTSWSEAACDGSGTPPIFVQALGEVECGEPEFNCGRGDANANAIMFRDDDWPYPADALAITTVSVNTMNGEILDADMELNSLRFDFTLDAETEGADLLSVLTHEVGHVLGLDHTRVATATMFATYDPGSAAISELDEDDRDGICSIYGAEDADPECEGLELADDTGCLGGTECTAPRRESCALVSSGAGGSKVPVALLGVIFGAMVVRRARRYAANPLATSPESTRSQRH